MDKLTQEDGHNATIFQRYRYLVSAFLKAYDDGLQWEIHERLARLRELNEEVIDVRRTDVDGS